MRSALVVNCDHRLVDTYLATDLVPIDDYRGPDADEYLDLVRVPWREAVTTAFSKLRGNGSIEMDGRAITIPWDVVRAREEALRDETQDAA